MRFHLKVLYDNQFSLYDLASDEMGSAMDEAQSFATKRKIPFDKLVVANDVCVAFWIKHINQVPWICGPFERVGGLDYHDFMKCEKFFRAENYKETVLEDVGYLLDIYHKVRLSRFWGGIDLITATTDNSHPSAHTYYKGRDLWH